MSSQQTALITPQSDIEDFTRFEFKYVLNSDRVGLVERDIRQFMTYDGHISADYDDNYYVRSLYFDDRQRRNYYEKIDGMKSRRKYRLRTYAPEPDAAVPIFLEEKNRIDNRVFKYRTRLDPDSVALLDDDVLRLKERHPNNVLIDRFAVRQFRSKEKPVVVVSYLRRAFVSDYDINFRITLDSKLQAAPSRHLFGALPGEVRSCMAGYTIMEIKFARRIPSWFHRILQSYQLQRLSISKFCKAMEACRLAVDLS
jgi:hypothetical protein